MSTGTQCKIELDGTVCKECKRDYGVALTFKNLAGGKNLLEKIAYSGIASFVLALGIILSLVSSAYFTIGLALGLSTGNTKFLFYSLIGMIFSYAISVVFARAFLSQEGRVS